jgi:hypothetical protein
MEIPHLQGLDDREIRAVRQMYRRLLRILKSRNVEQIEDEIRGKENRPPTPPPPPTGSLTGNPLQNITNIVGTGACEECYVCKNLKVGGKYVMYQNGECYTVLNYTTGRVLAYCTTKEKAEKQIDMLNRMEEEEELQKGYEKDKSDIVKLREEAHAEVVEKAKKIKRKYNKKEKSKMQTWREFYAQQTKGKKFGSRAEVNAHMKQCSVEYKAMKAKSK